MLSVTFKKQWEHPDTYKKWHFRGYTIGAIALEVVLAIFSGGAALGAKVLAKIGKYFPKLMKVLNKLLKVADKLDFRKKRGKGHKHKDHDRDHDSDRDRKHKDDEDMSNDDRAWEQARLMASMITEQHDLKDTPVAELLPILNATIGAKYKVVHYYKANLIAPNTYKIIQASRRNDIVDKKYTERETEESENDKELKKVYNSLREAPEYPDDFRSIQNGTRKLNVKNRELLEKLREVESGEWKKVYKDGYSNGERVSIHYFQSRSGKVFNVKVKNGWSNS